MKFLMEMKCQACKAHGEGYLIGKRGGPGELAIRKFHGTCQDCGGQVLITLTPELIKVPRARNQPIRITRAPKKRGA